jgi:NitT/TauT family transport system permease protein
MRKRSLNILIQIIGILILLSLWEGLTRLFNVPEFIFPKISSIFLEFIESPAYFGKAFFITYMESVLGLLLGGSLAYILALLFSFSRIIKQLFYQWFVMLKTVPIIAISPLVILWVGSGLISKILMSSIITFFPILVNTLKGLYNITDNQIKLFRSLNASNWQIFMKLRVPMSIGYLFAGLKIASPLSTIGAIVAEFSGANEGLGYIVLKSSWESNTVALMTAVILASIMGITLYKIIELIEYIISMFFPHFRK